MQNTYFHKQQGKYILFRVVLQYGITCLPAIEIDCRYDRLNFHVLGYGIDVTNPAFNALGERLEQENIANSQYWLDKTNDYFGFSLTKSQMDDLCPNGVYTGEAFAEALLNDDRYLNHEALLPYRPGGQRSDNPYVNFYWDWYSQGKPCYKEIALPTLSDTIALITQNNGVPVLAHPGNNLYGCYELFDKMVDIGIQGVEAFSSYHDSDTVDYFYRKGLERNLLITCGSDFHGRTKPQVRIGATNCSIDEEEIEKGLERYGLL